MLSRWLAYCLLGSFLSTQPAPCQSPLNETIADTVEQPNFPPTLTSISQIRALSVTDASKSLPVNLRGIVVGLEPELSKHFFIHDSKEGCFVKVLSAENFSRLTPGDEVDVTGVTDPLGFYPSIREAVVRVIGKKELPEPTRPKIDEMFSPKLDSEWVEVPAVVIGSELGDGRHTLTVEVYGNQFKAELPIRSDSALRTASLMQRRVLLRGVMGTIFNQDKQMTDRHFFLSSLDSLIPISPQLRISDRPMIQISKLLTGNSGPDVAVRISGVITQLDPRGFFLRDESGSTLVHQISSTQLIPGLRVEVAGFAAVAPFRPVMRATRVHALGLDSAPPTPVPMNPNLPDLSRFHSEWVTIEAEFQGLANSRHEEILQFRSMGRYFEASIPLSSRTTQQRTRPLLRTGDQVRLTGICELTTTHALPRLNWVDGMRLHLPTSGGIQVLSSAPWWTMRRLFVAFGVMTGIAALAMLTSWTLRRQVKGQMQVISEKLRAEAVGEERDRMARELHDTLEQQLSGVALQLDGLDDMLANQPQKVPNALELARRMLRFTREEAHRSVWDLRSQVLEREGLAAALRAIGDPYTNAAAPRIEVYVNGDEHPLSPGYDFHLLRIAQEALTNSVKHGKAKLVNIGLEYSNDHTRLTIVDDGVGYDPARTTRSQRPHFGLLGMRERAAKIGAEFVLESSPGQGCGIIVSVPQPSRS